MKTAGIYLVACGGVTYVGQSTDLGTRKNKHRLALQGGYHSNKQLSSHYTAKASVITQTLCLTGNLRQADRKKLEDLHILHFRSLGLETNMTNSEASRHAALFGAAAGGRKGGKVAGTLNPWSKASQIAGGKASVEAQYVVRAYISPDGELLLSRHKKYAPTPTLYNYSTQGLYGKLMKTGPFKGWSAIDPTHFNLDEDTEK